MADFTQAVTFTAGQPITAGQHNDAWDNVETWLNATIAPLINDSGYTAGMVALANAGGVPAMTALSGALTVSGAGATTIGSAQDTQSANITADGVLTGISITPGAGTYLAIATAEMATRSSPSSVAADATLSVRANAVAAFAGPASAIDAGGAAVDVVPLVAAGLVTVSNGAHAVDVFADLTLGAGNAPEIRNGRLVLVRLA